MNKFFLEMHLDKTCVNAKGNDYALKPVQQQRYEQVMKLVEGREDVAAAAFATRDKELQNKSLYGVGINSPLTICEAGAHAAVARVLREQGAASAPTITADLSQEIDSKMLGGVIDAITGGGGVAKPNTHGRGTVPPQKWRGR